MNATSPPSPVRRMLGGILAGALLTFGLVAAPPSAQADTAPPVATVPETVAADALPTWQVTGVVWSQVVVGNTVYATGNFTKARPPGAVAGAATEINVAHLIAYDITTGNRIASFNHTLNAQGLAITASPDGSRVYVGGDFTTVDGVVRQHLAAFDTASGALVAGFAPFVNGQVKAITASNTTVYAGGSFESAAGQVRRRLASFVATNGAINPWAPTADDGYVWSMTLTPDRSKVVVGGQFKTLNGVLANGQGAVDAVTAASRPWAASSIITAYGGGSVDALTADANYIYGGAYSYGTGGKFEGSFSLNPNDGSIRWLADCLGDTYDVEPVGDVVYTASHSHNCLSINAFPDTVPRTRYQHTGAYTNYATGVNKGPNTYGWNYGGQPAPTNLHFYPKMTVGLATGQYQASWSVVSGSGYVAMGGEFPTVNGKPQQGLTRFATKTVAANKVGPQYLDTAPVRDTIPATTAVSISPGTIRVNFGSAWDPDNTRLTYQLYRDRGTPTEKLLKTFTTDTNWWTVPTQLYTDTVVPPGSHTYQVKITDPFDNQLLSPVSAPVTAAATSPYAKQVIDDGADHYWRLGDTGTPTYDSASTTDGKAGSGVTRGTTGAITTDPDKASTFSGTSAGTIGMGTDFSDLPAPNTFTTEGWFKTTSTAGGKVLGYGTALVGDSGGNDRHVYLGNTGRVTFGVYPGSTKTISSAAGYNDGQWHMFTAQLSSAGMALYLDGQLIGRDTTVTAGQSYRGWWRIGGDKTGTWPNAGTSGYLNGSVDDIATYPNILTPAQISDHYAKRSAAVPANQPPVAAFTSSTTGFDVSFDASSSTDPDGTIASYGWDFGDGQTGTGASPSHTYSGAGTYPVKLTVTDNQGASDTKTVDVTLTAAPNVAPTANFTSTVSGLTASFDASSSTDTDGTIASYAWDFGDSTADGSGKTPSHPYAANGAYSVKLTVTDDDGDTDTVTKSVTISGTLARDTFNRTVATGWGSADVGGAWAYTGATNLFTVGANAGTIKMGAAGSGPSARLPISSTDTDLQFSFSFDKLPTGGGENVYSIVRGDQTNGYAAKVLAKADNTMAVYLTRTVGGTEASPVLSGKVLTTTFVPGTKYTVRTQAWGTGTTNLRAKVWKSDTTEPVAWSVTATDTTASLQSAGGIAVRAYLSGSATNAPVTLSVSNLTAAPTGN